MRPCFVLAALAAVACTSSDTTVVPPPPPTIELASLPHCTDGTSPAYPSAAGDVVPIELAVTNLLLRPPGVCYGALGCGHLRATVDPGGAQIESSSTFVDVPVPALGVEVTVTIEALDDYDDVLDGSDGKPAQLAFTLTGGDGTTCTVATP